MDRVPPWTDLALSMGEKGGFVPVFGRVAFSYKVDTFSIARLTSGALGFPDLRCMYVLVH